MASIANDYRHIDKDPIIDLIRTEAQRQGDDHLGPVYLHQLAAKSGISDSTLRNWFFGKTRRPQHLTVRFVLRALDCRMKVVRRDGSEVKGRRAMNNPGKVTP